MDPNLKNGKEFAQLNSRRRDMLRILHRIEEGTAKEITDALSLFRGTNENTSTTRSNIRALSQLGFVNEEVENPTEYQSPKVYELSDKGLLGLREYGRLSGRAQSEV